ncbi:hypothetical protein K458DRAFT_391309 [Lentithecium fluviatile CBS 122367]|uniref:Uncharacterized protein n=1 Tax=Lentithecium fluviatile CBS 122367 TaxID=1168545 RepID=A0A6G1IVK4_9PLEO|nr:hypothetical protein K458DRAFT_391309 [Lentithecium fluviatile CBS 122367]
MARLIHQNKTPAREDPPPPAPPTPVLPSFIFLPTINNFFSPSLAKASTRPDPGLVHTQAAVPTTTPVAVLTAAQPPTKYSFTPVVSQETVPVEGTVLSASGERLMREVESAEVERDRPQASLTSERRTVRDFKEELEAARGEKDRATEGHCALERSLRDHKAEWERKPGDAENKRLRAEATALRSEIWEEQQEVEVLPEDKQDLRKKVHNLQVAYDDKESQYLTAGDDVENQTEAIQKPTRKLAWAITAKESLEAVTVPEVSREPPAILKIQPRVTVTDHEALEMSGRAEGEDEDEEDVSGPESDDDTAEPDIYEQIFGTPYVTVSTCC